MASPFHRASRLACVAMLVGCVGDITPGGGQGITPFTPPSSDPNAFACAPGSQGTVTPLRRLAALQYTNTLKSLFAVAPGLDVATAAQTQLATVPVDEVALTYNGMDARLSENHVQAYYDVADAIAAAAIASDS